MLKFGPSITDGCAVRAFAGEHVTTDQFKETAKESQVAEREGAELLGRGAAGSLSCSVKKSIIFVTVTI